MTTWEGKTRGGVTGYKIFVFFITKFGLAFSYFFLHFVALYFIIVSRKAYKAIFRYFHIGLKYGKIKSFFSVYRNFRTFGKVLIDKIAVLSSKRNLFTFDFDGEEYLRNMVSGGTGGILINAHVGNWEIAGQLLERLNTRIHLLMYDAEHEKVKEYLDNVLTEKNISVILINENLTHLNEIHNALSNRELIAINGDRFVEGNKTCIVNFLGMKTELPCGPFSLAAKYKVPVTFAFAMKESKTHYHFYATEPIYIEQYKTLKEKESILKAKVQEYADELERQVRKYPLQWFNYYDFWKNNNG